MNALVTVNGSAANLPTLLGRGTPRLHTAGKIRAGIKVLTAQAAGHPKAKEIYERAVAANRPFEDIERLIKQAVPELKTPLVPKNVPYFTVRGEDFLNPDIAAHILALYGEERGDGVRRLYRLPVVFPADQWQTVMPHQLVAWGANDKRYWSEYAPDGQTRHCLTFAPVPVDRGGKRTVRLFGGRKTMLRADNGGICDPEHCFEYQQRQCNLSGRFIFFIPGIPSVDAFELQTNSFYALNAAIQKFQAVAFLRGGRIAGFIDGRCTPFYLTKRLAEITRIDDQGRAVRTPQWLIELEAPIDVTALLRRGDEEAVARDAERARQVLEGAAWSAEPEGMPPPIEADDGEGGSPNLMAGATAPAATTSPEATSLEAVLTLAEHLGIAPERYQRYADQRWGAGWKLNANGRRRALGELQQFELDPAALADRIADELGDAA